MRFVWKTTPNEVRVTRDEVSGKRATQNLSGRQYYTAIYVVYFGLTKRPDFEHPTCKGKSTISLYIGYLSNYKYNAMESNTFDLKWYSNLIDEHINQIGQLLSNNNIKKACDDFRKEDNKKPKNRINVFTIMSDKYHRENFHSDVIKFFLDPYENHFQGNKYLNLFIDFLNSKLQSDRYVDINYYTDVIVKVEDPIDNNEGRIDISIKSESSKHCVIIENKMNNAKDTERQLPKYFDDMVKHGYTVDAMIYLPIDPNKKPDKSSWTKDDRVKIKPPLLSIFPAIDLVNGWLNPCIQLSDDIDCISVLRQYGELIKLLTKNIMDNFILEKFYQALLENESSRSTAISVQQMMGKLPFYMRDRMEEKLREANVDGFDVWKWQPEINAHCGVKKIFNGDEYKIDVWSGAEGYGVYVFGQRNTNGAQNRFFDFAERMPILKSLGFWREPKHYMKKYPFTGEDDVIRIVCAIRDEMAKVIDIMSKENLEMQN